MGLGERPDGRSTAIKRMGSLGHKLTARARSQPEPWLDKGASSQLVPQAPQPRESRMMTRTRLGRKLGLPVIGECPDRRKRFRG